MDYRPPDLPRHVRGLRKLAVDQAEHIAALQAQLAEVSEEKRELRKRLNKALEQPKAPAPVREPEPVTPEPTEAELAPLRAIRTEPAQPSLAGVMARIHAAGVAS